VSQCCKFRFSDLLFEQYLFSQGLDTFEYEKNWEGIPTHPDYTVSHNNELYIFDVKEFEAQPFPSGTFAVEPYGRIREKINAAYTQFKYFKDKPCCLVLYTHDPFVRLREPAVVLAAMYGDLGFTTLYNTQTGSAVPGSTKRAFLKDGKMFRYESRRAQNQTFSALITLRYVYGGQQKHLGVIVWENDFARIEFPHDMFCGPYDERWGQNGDVITRIFAGEGVLTLEEFSKSES